MVAHGRRLRVSDMREAYVAGALRGLQSFAHRGWGAGASEGQAQVRPWQGWHAAREAGLEQAFQGVQGEAPVVRGVQIRWRVQVCAARGSYSRNLGLSGVGI